MKNEEVRQLADFVDAKASSGGKVRALLPETKKFGFSSWFEAHSGDTIHLHQFTIRDTSFQYWYSGPRLLDRVHKQRVVFNTSDGGKSILDAVNVSLSNDHTMVLAYPWGDGHRLCIYTVNPIQHGGN